MSSHGGFIGVLIALLWTVRKHRWDLFVLADLITVPVAIGLALGRLGNFINQELYGPVTTLPWGIAIPGVEGLRHPTQIYAMIKDLFIASVCFWHLRYAQKKGQTMALFLILYGLLRFLIEYVRIQEYGWIHIGFIALSRGQLLTIPIFLFGMGLLWKSREKK